MVLLRWFITVVITIAVLGFTLSNLEQVDVQLTPFTGSYTLPLYFLILGSVALGFIWGGLLVWLNTYPQRRDGQKAKKRVDKLEKELDEEREKKKNTPPAQILESPSRQDYLENTHD
ncbi:MAG: hypothetical protein CL565_05555 [Alphaproteobacteria bacterium]|nr:hypothetical protein [Alphaproteobacteria bacterium]|tara:strand:+ start:769 stop:1119 length:351 start_codon:yes stop_codon:yes gene_type:complete